MYFSIKLLFCQAKADFIRKYSGFSIQKPEDRLWRKARKGAFL